MYICRDCQEIFNEPEWEVENVTCEPEDISDGKEFTAEMELIPTCPYCGTYDIEKYIEE